MKYLNKFDTMSDYEVSASTLDTPNVAYITATTDVIYNATAPVQYVQFADQLVEQKCIQLYSSDGIGCTEADLGAVTSLNALDWSGTPITSFDELRFFTGLTNITDNAFNGCSSLTSITIPNSVTEIKQNAFLGNGLTSIVIPNSVTQVWYSAFYNNTGLTSVTIGSSVSVLGGYCFYGCSSLSAIAFMSDTPPTLGFDGVFSGQPSTGNLTVPVGSEANYYALAQTIGANWTVNNQTPPVYVQFADPLVASKCATLYGDGVGCTEANLGAVTTMRASDWSGTSITSFNELQYFTGLTSLPQSIFEGCSSLASVTFPASDSFTDVGERAFSGCTSLSTMTFVTSTPPTADIGAFDELPPDGNLVVPEGFKDNFYILAEQLGGWRVNGEIHVEYVQFNDPLVEQKCIQLYSSDGIGCTMEDLAAVATMNASDWSGTSITSFNELGNWFTGLNSLPQGLFKDCANLTSVSIPIEVSNIGADTFRDCTSLTDVDLGIVSRISTNAFYGCTSLRYMFFPDFATIQIDGGAFDGCTALSSLEFMSGTLPTVTNSAFPSAPSTGNIKVPDGSESNYYSFARSLGAGWTVNGETPPA